MNNGNGIALSIAQLKHEVRKLNEDANDNRLLLSLVVQLTMHMFDAIDETNNADGTADDILAAVEKARDVRDQVLTFMADYVKREKAGAEPSIVLVPEGLLKK